MNNICLIPAREVSTRFEGKNISKFGEGTLIGNTIEQAIDSHIFDRIILSSNSQKILDEGSSYKKAELHKRTDRSEDQLIHVVRMAIEDFELNDEDMLCLLLVTCPLRHYKDIIKAYRLFLDYDKQHPIISVRRNLDPVQMAFKLNESKYLEPVMPVEFNRSTRKQDHVDTFFFNDALIIDRIWDWRDEYRPHLYGRMPMPYLMPPERSIAIDYEFQLIVARLLGEYEKCQNSKE